MVTLLQGDSPGGGAWLRVNSRYLRLFENRCKGRYRHPISFQIHIFRFPEYKSTPSPDITRNDRLPGPDLYG